VESDIAMTALRNQPTTTTPECRHAALGAGRTRAIVPDGFGAARAAPQALHLARAGTGTDAPRTPVPHPQPAGWVDTSGRDATAQQFRVTPKTPVLPRWPTYRSMRLDQPSR
jgi:hypothetical protein